MFSRKNKSAIVIDEVIISILLLSLAVIVVTKLFGNNIAEMINNNSFKQAIEKGNERKTTFKMTNKGSVRYNISAPEAQMAGWEAVLGRYNTNAKESIEDYYKKAQTTPLTDAEVKDLAKWLAIFANSAPPGSQDTGQYLLGRTFFGTNSMLSFYQFGTSQGLNLSLIDNYTIYQSSTNTLYSWEQNNPNALAGITANGEPQDRVANIRDENGIIYTFEHTQ